MRPGRPLTPARQDSVLLTEGLRLLQSGRPEEALRLIERSVKLAPKSVAGLANLGNVLLDLQRPREALSAFDRALKLLPRNADLLSNRGNALAALNRHREAADCYRRALAAEPGFVEAYINLGSALSAQGRSGEALDCLDRSVELAPQYSVAWFNRGVVLRRIGRLQEALASHQRATAIQPDFAAAWREMGSVYRELGQDREAVGVYEQALQVVPGDAEAWYERGRALSALRDAAGAIHSFEQALRFRPDYAAALDQLGNVLRGQKRLHGALERYGRALALEPNSLHIRYNQGLVLNDLGRLEEAAACFDDARAAPELAAEAASMALVTRQWMCAWDRFDQDRSDLARLIASGEPVNPFVALLVLDSPEVQRQAARNWAKQVARGIDARSPVHSPRRHDRIRLAYVSSDYRLHATGFLTAELFERHDRGRFETYAFSLAASDGTPMRRRLEAGFDHFIDCESLEDQEIAAKIVESEIDIAVDLNGYTRHARARIFAGRPAPVQVSFLGYPGTMGADWIDYLVADHYVVPPGSASLFDENIVFLPDTYQVNQTASAPAGPAPSRGSLGLPDRGVVFCCFNQFAKITPNVFGAWACLLKKVEGSVLWLFADKNEIAPVYLRRAAAQVGVSGDRLIFAPYADQPEHLARLAMADIFLDTAPYNAHTTASDALRSGVPVVTSSGGSFPARVAGSLLHAIGVTETIASDMEHYESIALRLARDSAFRASVRQKILDNQTTHPLFDAARFCRHLETAYETMWQTHCAGELPRSFSVKPSACFLP